MSANRDGDGGATPRLLVLTTALLFSTGGAVIKATQFSGWQVASFRCGIAALALIVLMPSARRRWGRRTLWVGCAYAGALITYAVANKLTTAANTIFIYSTTPLYVLFLGPWLLGEPFQRRDLGFMAVFATGLALVFLDSPTAYETAPDPFTGNLVACVGGFCFALAVMGLRWLSRPAPGHRGSPTGALVAGNLIAFLACLPLALPVSGVAATDWVLVTFLGVFQIGLAYGLLTAALRRVPALETSLLLLIEPVLNPLWAWQLHGERPGTRAMIGGAVILMASATMTLVSLRAVSRARALVARRTAASSSGRVAPRDRA